MDLSFHPTVPALVRSPTLLHLTDLHFGPVRSKGHYWNSDATELALPKYDRRGLLGSLLDDLAAQKLAPDLVLVTGDLLDRGVKSGIRLAGDFLAALAEGLGLARTRVVLIPGNHDVLRVPDPAERYAAFDKIFGDFYGTLRAPPAAGVLPHERVEHLDFGDDLGLEVVAFNSCEALDPPKQEHGSVGLAQRRCAESLLARTESKGLFRIALMHHHLERPTGTVRKDISVMDDAGAIREWLARHRFQLALHGHQHVDWERIEEIRGWFLSISAGGSAGVGRYGRADWDLRLGYQVIAIDSAERGRRIRREYDPQSRMWMAARGNDGPETRLRFGAATVVNRDVPDGRVPTKGSLRRALAKVLPMISLFDAFCVNCFPDVAHQLSDGMSRATKESHLLTMHAPDDVLRALRREYPAEIAKHEDLVEYA